MNDYGCILVLVSWLKPWLRRCLCAKPRLIGDLTGALPVASGGRLGLLWLTFARHEKMAHRVHQGLDGETPGEVANAETPAPPASFQNYTWQSHCNGLFELPIAA